SDFDEVATLTDLGIPHLESWVFKHSLVELCTAVKGPYLDKLLRRPGCSGVFYFDPDMAVFNRLDPLFEGLERGSVVLTPHQLDAEEDEEAVIDNEICSLKHGVYNLGFIGVRPSTPGLQFASWWRARLEQWCYADIPSGIFTDQRWVDLAPALFDCIEIIRDRGCNVATWNLSHRLVEGNFDSGFTVNGAPLRFYHFSGFDSGAQQIMLRKYGRSM